MEENEKEEHSNLTCPDCGFTAPNYAYGDLNKRCNM